MRMWNYKNMLLGLMLVMLALPYSCKDDFADPNFGDREEYMLVYDYIQTRSDLSIYKDLCDYTGFYSYISTAGYYSIFAPVDSAWQAYFKEKGIGDFKEKGADYWMKFLKYHAVEHKAKVNTNSYNSGRMDDPTMLDKNYYLTVDVSSYAAVKLNNKAVIREYNINLQNGYLQLIDAVIEPPIMSVFEVLKGEGKYESMLGLFEANGLKSWLTDSVITLFIEPDFVYAENAGKIEAMPAEVLKDWLMYHIFPGDRHFSSELDNKMFQPLYPGDVVTFNKNSDGFFWNQRYQLGMDLDKNAQNGVVHTLGSVVMISEHTPGTVEYNLYGGTNLNKGYVKNTFAETPAMVLENLSYASYHQRVRNIPKPPICMFQPSQKNDAFTVTIPDVLPGNYTVKLVYRDESKPKVTLHFNSQSLDKVDLSDSDATKFPEYDRMKVHAWKTKIEVKEKGEVALKFVVEDQSILLLERVDLVPDVVF